MIGLSPHIFTWWWKQPLSEMCSIFVVLNIGLMTYIYCVVLDKNWFPNLASGKQFIISYFCHKQYKVSNIKLQPVLLLYRIVTLRQNWGQYCLERWWWKSFPPARASCNKSFIISMPRSTSSSKRICLHVYKKQSSLSEHSVICAMKGWVLMNITALAHRWLLVWQQFSRHGTMVLSYQPHPYNFTFSTSFVEERTKGL